MDIQNLIKQANQIGDFFGAWPDTDQGCREITSHLKRFWEPRMRRQLADYVRDEAGVGLAPIVIAAVKQLEPAGEGA